MHNPDKPIDQLAFELSELTGNTITVSAIQKALYMNHLATRGLPTSVGAVALGITERWLKTLSRQWGVRWSNYDPFAKSETRPTTLLDVCGVPASA